MGVLWSIELLRYHLVVVILVVVVIMSWLGIIACWCIGSGCWGTYREAQGVGQRLVMLRIIHTLKYILDLDACC